MGSARAVHFSPKMKIPMIIATLEDHIVSTAEKRFVKALKEQVLNALQEPERKPVFDGGGWPQRV
jgi:hypothetical protein